MPTLGELKLYQSLPLELKIAKTRLRILEWVKEFGQNDIHVSFSGGKDSTVLLHLVREMFPETEAVFVDTGLEYPEVREFAKSFENVTVLRPMAKILLGMNRSIKILQLEFAQRYIYSGKYRNESWDDYCKRYGFK